MGDIIRYMWVYGVKKSEIESLYDSDDGPVGIKDRLGWIAGQFGRVGVVQIMGERAYVGVKNVQVEIEKMGNKVMLTSGEDRVRVFEGRVSPDLKIYVNNEQAVISNLESLSSKQILNPKSKNLTLPRIDIRRMVEKIKMGLAYRHDTDGGRKIKKTIYIGLGFLVLGIVLFGVGGYRRAETDLKKSADYLEVESMWSEFEMSKGDVAKLQNLKSKVDGYLGKDYEDRVKTIRDQLPILIEEAIGVKRVDLSELIDLGLVREGMKATKLALLSGKIWGLDTSEGRLVSVDIKKKSGDVIAGADDLGKPIALASYPGRVVIFGDKGGVQCDTGNSKCKQVITVEQVGEGVVEIGMFAGNIYSVDSTGEIWRYSVTDTGYGPKTKWIGEDQAKASGVTGLTIDGSIWLTATFNAGTGIQKYTRGVKDNIEISGLDTDFGLGASMYTSSDVEKMYVLDPQKERIVTLDKTGKYESQVKSALLKEATDLVVDDEEVIYLAVGSKIYTSEGN